MYLVKFKCFWMLLFTINIVPKWKKEQAGDNAKEKLEYFKLFFDLEILSNTNKYLCYKITSS